MSHVSPSRGMEAAGADPELSGAKFGRLFPHLPAASYGETPQEEEANLKALADAMVSKFDAPFDGVDDEESGIPALYTYFGQFIDHDLTFGPESAFTKVKDPMAVTNFRTPAFDLDCLYGRGPNDQPYLYEADGKTIKLGAVLQSGSPGIRDLQRNGDGIALIGDPRNDENAIITQLQGLLIKFHNGLVKESPNKSFFEIQAEVQHRYQYILINDFLGRIVNADVLDELKTKGSWDKNKIKWFCDFKSPHKIPFIPLEFAVAAYRLGHSMIRPGYRLNDNVLLPIFPLAASETGPEFPDGLPDGLTGFRELNPNWGLDWGRLIDIDVRSYGFPIPEPGEKPLSQNQLATNTKRLQFAYKIDTALTKPLGTLPKAVVSNPPVSLALRNLKRALSFAMPSGQAVARHMDVQVLPNSKILIGQAVDQPGAPLPNIETIANGAFRKDCPLWTYILAEAIQHKASPSLKIPVTEKDITVGTPQLGPVGGRIVAEVFLGLLFADPNSFLNVSPTWSPHKADYKLKDLVAEALNPQARLVVQN